MEVSVNRFVVPILGFSLLALATGAHAADHLFSATGAGGLTSSSQPFQNGLNNPG